MHAIKIICYGFVVYSYWNIIYQKDLRLYLRRMHTVHERQYRRPRFSVPTVLADEKRQRPPPNPLPSKSERSESVV